MRSRGLVCVCESRQLQQALGIMADGVVGSQTLRVLAATIAVLTVLLKALLLTLPLAALAAWAAWQGFEALPDTTST